MVRICKNCNHEMTNFEKLNINGDGSTREFYIAEKEALLSIIGRKKYFIANINCDICLECGSVEFYINNSSLDKLKTRVKENFK